MFRGCRARWPARFIGALCLGAAVPFEAGVRRCFGVAGVVSVIRSSECRASFRERLLGCFQTLAATRFLPRRDAAREPVRFDTP